MASEHQQLRGQLTYGATEQRRGFFDGDERGGSFEDLSQQISNLVFKINSNASSVERQSKKIGTKDDGPPLREKLHNVMHETKEISSNITELLKKLNHSAARNDRQKRIQVERLKTSFRSSLERYNSIQKKVKDQINVENVHVNQQSQNYDHEEDNWSDQTGLLEAEQRRQQLQQQQIEVEDELAITRDREERIRELESDVIDVNEIFKELGTMVHEQGEMVDDIEANVVSAADHVTEGNVQLHKAVTYQKGYRKKLCILVVILLVVAAIVTVIIVVSVKH